MLRVTNNTPEAPKNCLILSEIANFNDLSLFTPIRSFMKWKVKKRGDHKMTTWLRLKHDSGCEHDEKTLHALTFFDI